MVRDHSDLDNKLAHHLTNIIQSDDVLLDARRAQLRSINENKLVIEPRFLSPVLESQDQTINELQRSASVLRSDLSFMSEAVSLLLNDSQQLRSFQQAHLADTENLIKSISEHEGEVVQTLRANNQLLSEENRVLEYENSMLKELRKAD